MIFKGNEHKRIFTREIAHCKSKHIPYYFLSALFLLTSNKKLWQRASKQVSVFKINWKAIDIRGVGVHEYALYKLAKDLYHDTSYLTIMDLYDDQIFNDQAIQMVYSALDIRRHGMALFSSIGRKENNHDNKPCKRNRTTNPIL